MIRGARLRNKNPLQMPGAGGLSHLSFVPSSLGLNQESVPHKFKLLLLGAEFSDWPRSFYRARWRNHSHGASFDLKDRLGGSLRLTG